jgi:potassium-transporting ATPase potassium-binding subunit
MMLGRFGLAIPALCLAGLFAAQQPSPDSAGTLPVTSFSFALLLTFTALIVSALSYFPALALGPILEHLTMVR